MQVKQIKNEIFNSNTYIIISKTNCLIVDPCNPTNSLTEYINKSNLKPLAVLLTHEHADHCSGVDNICAEYDIDLYCSKKCAENIKNPKYNFSRYIEPLEEFSVKSKATIIEDEKIIKIMDFNILLMETPGHSPGSACFFIDNFVFTGDTLMKNIKTPLHFPNSNKEEYHKSIEKLNNRIKPSMTIYCGH
jgi:hydroxyacylglutathione hydrolase